MTFIERGNQKNLGFTLIELLIVIAIILILIAIALPNFLEAQIRAKVVRAKSELRSLDTALAAYYLDWEIYPEENEADISTTGEGLGLLKLSTPISYITSIPEDPFGYFESTGSIVTYESGGMEVGRRNMTSFRNCLGCLITWVIFTKGPDGQQHIRAEHPHFNCCGRDVRNYSPTNGTKSRGSIYQWGGDTSWMGVEAPEYAPTIRNDPNRLVGRTVDGITYFKKFPPAP